MSKRFWSFPQVVNVLELLNTAVARRSNVVLFLSRLGLCAFLAASRAVWTRVHLGKHDSGPLDASLWDVATVRDMPQR